MGTFANGETGLSVRTKINAAIEAVEAITPASIKTDYESNLDTNAFTDAEQSKLSGIEAGATADQTGAEIKAAYEAEADTNAYTDAEKTKLAGIEAGATADQSGAEIKAAYEAEANTNAFTDAEQTKLAGIEASADVTDTANVTSAGAVMAANNLSDVANAATSLSNLGGQPLDATLTSIAALGTASGKYLYTTGIDTWAEGTITAAGRAILDDASASAQRTTLGLAIGSDVQAYDAELAAIAGLTSAANKVPYFTGSGTAGLLDFLDEDTMSSDSATAVPSQQSVKAYVDAAGLTLSTAVATTSGTAFDFTDVPAGANEVYLILDGVSLSGTDSLLVQLGDSGGIETSGYTSGSGYFTTSAQNAVQNGAAFPIRAVDSTAVISGILSMIRLTGNTWSVSGNFTRQGTSGVIIAAGSKTLSAEMTQFRLTRSGTDTFSAGQINGAYR